MKNVLLSLALVSCAMGSAMASEEVGMSLHLPEHIVRAQKEMNLLTRERDECQRKLQQAQNDIARLNEQIARAETAVTVAKEKPVQQPLEVN